MDVFRQFRRALPARERPTQNAPRVRSGASPPVSLPVLAVALHALVVPSLGCAYSGHPVLIQAPNRLPAHVEADGVVIGAESYASPDKAEFAFGEDVSTPQRGARPRGFLPILISIRNDTAEHILVDRDKSRLLSADGKTSVPATWRTMYRQFKGDEAGAALALGVAGGDAQRRANDDMARDWQKKELPDQKTLAPGGGGVGGFIYFRDKGGEGPYTLIVAVEKLKSSKSLLIEVAVAEGAPNAGEDDHHDVHPEATAGVEADIDAEVTADAAVEAKLSVDVGVGNKPKGSTLPTGRIKIIFDERTKQLRAPDGVILFELDKDALKNDDHTRRTLEAYREFLEKHPAAKLRIEGHTDSRADDRYNLDLSHRRARIVRRWLVDKGINEKRLEYEGKGERAPRLRTRAGDVEGVDPAEYKACRDGGPSVPADCEERVWRKNRRVEFHVTAGARSLMKRAPPAPSSPGPPPPAAACPFLIGPRLSALGPDSYLRIALASQPLCWLELSLGIGFQSHVSGESAVNAVPILLRGRFWFMESEHSLLADVGLGLAPHFVSSKDGSDGDVAFAGSLGLGYGYRSESPWRVALLLGAATYVTSAPAPAELLFAFPSGRDSGGFELGPYGEASLGYMF